MANDGFDGKRIRAMMAVRGFKTQSALAEAAKMHPSILSRIINGRYNPTDDEVQAIKAALNWDSQDEAALCVLVKNGT